MTDSDDWIVLSINIALIVASRCSIVQTNKGEANIKVARGEWIYDEKTKMCEKRDAFSTL